MKKDQELPLDQDMTEETEQQREFRKFMEELAYTASEDYFRELWRKE